MDRDFGRAMKTSFRFRLLLATMSVAIFSVVMVTWLVTLTTRRAFDELEAQRAEALSSQFQNEFERRGEEIARRVQQVGQSDAVLQMALDLARTPGNDSLYLHEAADLAHSQRLEYLELLQGDGTIISSAQWPARFGYKEVWIAGDDWSEGKPFLKNEELPSGNALAIMAVAPVKARDQQFFVVGGSPLDKDFLQSMVTPQGTRALLYRPADKAILSSGAPLNDVSRLQPLLEQARQQDPGAPDKRKLKQIVHWPGGEVESYQAIPLRSPRGEVLAVLLAGSSQTAQQALVAHIRWLAIIVGAGALLLAGFMTLWMSRRITEPIDELAIAAGEVQKGNWDARVYIQSSDELGELATTFNRMTEELSSQRERLVQSERVAAWRELARRLAHELKNPLFPLQITVENMMRARELSPEEFEEIFRESTQTLLTEIGNLKAIIGRFSDFSRMPAPEMQKVDVNELVRSVVHLFQAQFRQTERGEVAARLDLQQDLPAISADPALLRRVIENLVLNALDAMPHGGDIGFRTARADGVIRLEVCDSGSGLTPEECERLFTPYYTTKHHGTGLGLAIVQSVVSDHGGRVSVYSEKEKGTTFRIELPLRQGSATAV